MPALNFQKQFAPKVEAGEKCQTIRAHRKDGRVPAKRGDTLALYTGMRTKVCRKLMDANCTEVTPVNIDEKRITIDGRAAFPQPCLDDFARDDGFTDWADMTAWFKNTHGLPFQGWLIKWSPTSGNCDKGKDDG